MFDSLAKISNYKEFSVAAKALLGKGAFDELEDDMVATQTTFSHSDRWGKDKVARSMRTPAATDEALSKLVSEPEDKRVLHVLQLMQVGMPILANDIEHFLSRVTFK